MMIAQPETNAATAAAALSSMVAVSAESREAAPAVTIRRGWSEQELCKLAHRMSRGVEIKDRTWRLLPFRQCFLGEEAVRWLVREGHAGNETEAVAIGNSIAGLGLLEHVSKGHAFKNAYLFYRFTVNFGSYAPRDSDGDVVSRESEDSRIASAMEMVFLHAAEITQLQRSLAASAEEVELHKFTIGAMLEAADSNHRVTEALQERVTRLEGFVVALGVLVAALCLSSAVPGTFRYLGTAAAVALGGLAMSGMLADRPRLKPVNWELPSSRDQSFSGAMPGRLRSSSENGSWADEQSSNREAGEEEEGGGRGSRTTKRHRSSCAPQRSWSSTAIGSDSRASSAGGRGEPTAAEIEDSEDRPLLLRLRPDLLYQRVTDGSNPRSIPVNRPGSSFSFETDLFGGSAMLWVAGLDSSPPGLFKGQQRKTSLVVQGRFKRELPYDDVFTGQEFSRPIKNLPAKWMINLLLRIARKLSPSSIFGLLDAPHILTPLAAGAQCIHICKAEGGSEPPDLDAPPFEDMRAALPGLTDSATAQPLPSPQRKKRFSSAKARKNLVFDTDNVYTFHFWQHMLDLSTYELDMGAASFDISRNLDRQPLQLMVKRQSTGEYLWNLEVWHERLLRSSSSGTR